MATAHLDTRVGAASWTALKQTARTTGLFYVGLAITGIVGSLLVRSQLYDANDPAGTLSNLLAHPSLARLGIALELGVVLTQTLTAIWFYRLFRGVSPFAAASVAVFGMVNAVAILGSAAMLATAFAVARDPVSSMTADTAATVQLLYLISEHLLGVAGLFFGLWLIPMGHLAVRSDWLPRLLGWLLIVGGIGYVVSAFLSSMFPDNTAVSQLLAIPATVGELWIIGYLLTVGLRVHATRTNAPK